MKKLHKESLTNLIPESKEEHRTTLCSNVVGERCSSLDLNKSKLSTNEIKSLTQLAVSLKKIHIRLIIEGYIITDDDIMPPSKQKYE